MLLSTPKFLWTSGESQQLYQLFVITGMCFHLLQSDGCSMHSQPRITEGESQRCVISASAQCSAFLLSLWKSAKAYFICWTFVPPGR